MSNSQLVNVLTAASDELKKLNSATTAEKVAELMDELADSRVDIENVSSILAEDITDDNDIDNDALERELDSLLFQNDTEDVADIFNNLTCFIITLYRYIYRERYRDK